MINIIARYDILPEKTIHKHVILYAGLVEVYGHCAVGYGYSEKEIKQMN